MKLEEGEQVASTIINSLRPLSEKIEAVGSIRRKKPIVNDIDIVILPRANTPLGNFVFMMASHGYVGTASGEKICRFVDQTNHIHVDLYFTTPYTHEMIRLVRTGSKELNIRLAKIANRKGLHFALNGEGVIDPSTGKRVGGETEESVFKALGLDYIPPEKRDR